MLNNGSSQSQPLAGEWKWIDEAQASKGGSVMGAAVGVERPAESINTTTPDNSNTNTREDDIDGTYTVGGGKTHHHELRSSTGRTASMTMSLNSALSSIDEKEDKKAQARRERRRVTQSLHGTFSDEKKAEARRERRRVTQSLHSNSSNTSDSLDQSSRANISRRRRSSVPWRRKHTGKDEDRLATFDDEEGHAEFFLILLYESLDDSKLFVAGSIGSLIVWSVLCAAFAQWLRGLAVVDPGGRAERWMEDIENCKSAISILGTLFVFTLVFRFNTCYDRWWESRMFWGDIISRCLDLNMMNRRWITDQDLGDRLSRFIIAYSYASKALLRGTSLVDEGDGAGLVQRGILTQEELDDMHKYPCWQPHYCLEMIRAIIVEAHKVPGGKGIVCDEGNKIHGQFFRCFDGIIKQMTDLIGDSVRTRSSGLPASYDAITMLSFFMFFALAAFVWSIGIGWMTPVIIGCASLIVMLLIVMGSKLVDPFGYDKVDIPMEAFCATIEAQVHAIDERARSGIIEKFARTSRPRASMMKCATFNIPKLN